MNKKKVVMVVMNTLNTDARVQRAASALQDEYDLTVIGIGKDNGKQKYKQKIIELISSKSVFKYIEFVRKVKKLLTTETIDIFYGHDYFSAYLASWVKYKKPGVKVVYDSHELIINDVNSKLTPRDFFFYIQEKKAIKKVDLVISANEDRGVLMQEHYKMLKPPLTIENISELPIIDDDTVRTVVNKCRVITRPEVIILAYAGVLTLGRKIDDLIHLVEQRKDASLLIIGDGPDRERLEKIAKDLIPGRYHFTGEISYKYLGIILSKCDVGYISYPTITINNKYCAPNKIYEYASVGLPMIAPENPTLKKYFDKYKIGVINDDIMQAFNKVTSDIEEYKRNCRTFSSQNPWTEKAQILLKSINNLFV